ncbi:hypothetical protein K0T92_14570 [Paenibacillus oenotherae]|uniref:BppU N-terminal domain-containing protein n=1 Tax=Paenibacillus oenotherae TaxID=1435645 RepID=A0ABS7D7P7_9BACL|nr:hypothetical protein [Paenibacillus oenotherae]MBW7475967.1 hypothetical protein [Paenibacillus oenotherae]
MTQGQNFTMYAGDTKEIVVTIPDVDLLGATIKWAMLKTATGPTIIQRSTTVGIIVDADAGTFTFKLESADTENLYGQYYHEAELTDVLGNVSTIMTGAVFIKPSST